MAWPPRSPDFTNLDFSVWGYFKDKVFVPPLPASLEVQQARITEAVATIGVDTIHRIFRRNLLELAHPPRDMRKP